MKVTKIADFRETAYDITNATIYCPQYWKVVEAIEKQIIKYAKTKCREQRKLCAEGFLNTDDPAGYEILNEEEPNFN